MTTFDWGVLAVVALSTLFAFVRGVIRELIALIAWVLGIVAALVYAPALAAVLPGFGAHAALRYVIAFALLLIAALLAGALVAWPLSKVVRAAGLGFVPTPCTEWDVRTLLNHMLDTQQYFVRRARGEDGPPLTPDPPELIGDDPASAYERGREATIRTFSEPGVIERTGPSLGIAFSDLLIHGWDLAQATGEDATMPDGLPAAAYELIHGKFTDEQRKGLFKPEIKVRDDASPQEKLLAYTGRTAS